MVNIVAGDKVLDVINLACGADQPVLLIGRHGIGKSSFFEQAADRRGIGLIVCDLSLMEPVDLVGIPSINDNGRTVYAPPSFLPTDGTGLIVFEELNRAPRYVQVPCLQLLTARRLNDYALPPGWLPCAAINDGEEYQVDDLDVAILSRFLHPIPCNGSHGLVAEVMYIPRSLSSWSRARESSRTRSRTRVLGRMQATCCGNGNRHPETLIYWRSAWRAYWESVGRPRSYNSTAQSRRRH